MTRSPFFRTKLGIYARHTAAYTKNKRQIIRLTEFAVTDDFGNLKTIVICQARISAETHGGN